MKILNFQLEFLSDIVLPATSNTEGDIESLDFIPGSNFLGIVAKEYDKFSDSFAVFHSGDVRFSDATLVYKNKATYKMPLSFFHEKLDESVMYNHHLIKDFTKFKQLKQNRKGFITQDLQEVSIKHNYDQKSAYDKKFRRSKDGSMYGYKAMPKGLIWQFSVKCSENISQEDIERIKNNLVGQKRLGKSKSSQYGKVEIKEIATIANSIQEVASNELTILYAKSRLALIDNDGNATYDLQYLVDGLDKNNIVWEKSQLRTSTYMPYNSTMQTKCYERIVINAGSVIVLKDVDKALIERIKKGVGVYLNEGFGEILVNPSFLLKESFSFAQEDKNKSQNKALDITHDCVKFLQNRQEQKQKQLEMINNVQKFINNNKSLYANIKNSQWGTIRSICTSGREDFENEIEEYISSGKITWSNAQIEKLLKAIKENGIAFTKHLTIQMAKES